MRAFFFLLLSLSFGFVAAQDAAQETVIEFTDHPARVVTNINALNMRSSPAIEADNIVGRLQPGQQVHVIARAGEWQQVRSEDGLFGWSHSDYLIDIPTRQLGETRLFRIYDFFVDRNVVVNAELRHIGHHSYIYVSEHPRQSNSVDPNELNAFAEAFNEFIYPETLALWHPDPKPSHHGDERIVILMGVGYKVPHSIPNYYHTRGEMPGELHPFRNRTGFIDMTWFPNMDPVLLHSAAAHELQHLIQHHYDKDEEEWVHEGLSVFTSAHLGFAEGNRIHASSFQSFPSTQLNHFDREGNCVYGAAFLFTTYMYEQLGLFALQQFASRLENGLAALDVVLAEHDGEWNTETFFADWVLANFLRDKHLKDGRFGYQMYSSGKLNKPYVINHITQLPSSFQETNKQYATDYYEIALPPSDQPRQLELTLHFPDSAAQDGWLQLVQVVDGEVSINRFRASESRVRVMNATLLPNADQAFIAISPFRADARYIKSSIRYNLNIHNAGSDATIAGIDTSAAAGIAEKTEQLSPIQLALEVYRTIEEYAVNSASFIRSDDTESINRYVSRVRELLAAGADVSRLGTETLVAVVKFGPAEMLAMLLDAGTKPDANYYTYSFGLGVARDLSFPQSPLNVAINWYKVPHIQLLLDAGAQPNTRFSYTSSLHLASIKGELRIISMLLAAGADPMKKDLHGKAPADYARQFGHHAAAQMIEAAATN